MDLHLLIREVSKNLWTHVRTSTPSSHQEVESTFPALEPRLGHVSCFDQWDVTKVM